MYKYEVLKPYFSAYTEGWKIYIDIVDASNFEKAFRAGGDEVEWVGKLISILALKQKCI